MCKIQLIIFLISFSVLIESSFPIRRLDRNSGLEKAAAASLFEYSDITDQTTHNQKEIFQILGDQRKTTFVSEFFDGKKSVVVGLLIASLKTMKSNNQLAAGQEQLDVYFEALAVHPEFRNLGIATSLMEYVQHYALEADINYIYLRVYRNNFPAVACYRKQGFQVYDELYSYFEMRKKLAQDPFY